MVFKKCHYGQSTHPSWGYDYGSADLRPICEPRPKIALGLVPVKCSSHCKCFLVQQLVPLYWHRRRAGQRAFHGPKLTNNSGTWNTEFIQRIPKLRPHKCPLTWHHHCNPIFEHLDYCWLCWWQRCYQVGIPVSCSQRWAGIHPPDFLWRQIWN